ncbi:hypothetical protein A3862_05235 [Methylobacterium sp. XJLW]|uniref:hypothetical protein n=1 Tax=Methylobacterium sp. XJLW TaxID=739141 RepID=UPI000DAAE826|nr:hypothetical protein [Methylobacterium sp. XJLW]AWV14986.1 hypothetical protein A3862_05235 [Methylobacterium sp. XJLW]
MRKLSQLAALVLAAMAAAAQKVWDGSRWVARAFSGIPTPAGAEFEDAFDGVAARAAAPVTPSQSAQPARDTVTPAPAPTPKPVPTPAKIVELDPVLARGRLAVRFVDATFMLEPEEAILKECDPILRSWLLSLNAAEMMEIHRSGPHKVAAHLAGKRLLEGLPEIATESEFAHWMGQAARITPERRANMEEWDRTMDAAFAEMTADPAYELKCGI